MNPFVCFLCILFQTAVYAESPAPIGNCHFTSDNLGDPIVFTITRDGSNYSVVQCIENCCRTHIVPMQSIDGLSANQIINNALNSGNLTSVAHLNSSEGGVTAFNASSYPSPSVYSTPVNNHSGTLDFTVINPSTQQNLAVVATYPKETGTGYHVLCSNNKWTTSNRLEDTQSACRLTSPP